ncbi:hypothetical protein [Qaidamihabitans albus]|uniref:hypothetical protein n=1 Tax=Qaidamihabitans albus TaxID=2795733 RepID=UPI0018F23588|nr:hypothetical protein [Qaidamihabitans albus]
MSRNDQRTDIRPDPPGPRPEDWRHGDEAGSPAAGEGFPERMAGAARRVEERLNAGRPSDAVDLLDAMRAEIESWRRAAAESANLSD